MNRNTGYPLCPGLVFLHNTLFLKIVLEHSSVRGCEEMGLSWMKRYRLDDAFCRTERLLAGCP